MAASQPDNYGGGRRRNRGQHNQNLMISRPLSEEMYVEILPLRHTVMNTSDAVLTKPSQAVFYSMEYT